MTQAPFVNALTLFIQVLSIYFVLRTLEEAVRIFASILGFFQRQEELKTLRDLLAPKE